MKIGFTDNPSCFFVDQIIQNHKSKLYVVYSLSVKGKRHLPLLDLTAMGKRQIPSSRYRLKSFGEMV